MSGQPPGPDYHQEPSRTGGRPPGPTDRQRLIGDALRGAMHRAPRELDSADLTVAGGDTVQIVCIVEVMDWLGGLAARVEAGEDP